MVDSGVRRFAWRGFIGHPSTNGDVIIGNDVWIGDIATIMSGVTIGDGTVIVNNSHVVKSVEPYSLVGGNPDLINIDLHQSKSKNC